MDEIDVQEGLLQTTSLDEEVVDKWCLAMYISSKNEEGSTSVSSPIYIGLLAGNAMILTNEDVKTHLQAEWDKPASESNIIVTLCKSLLQTPKFADLKVARKIIKVLTRIIDWDTWPAEIAQDIPFAQSGEVISRVQIVPLKVSLLFDFEHALNIELQISMKDMIADIKGLDDRLLVSKFGHA